MLIYFGSWHCKQEIYQVLFPPRHNKLSIISDDETRVKLNIEEDDEISSDYINASYIKVCCYTFKSFLFAIYLKL